MKKLLIIALALSFNALAFGQTKEVTTITVDKKDGQGQISKNVMVVSGEEGDKILSELKEDPNVVSINVDRSISSSSHKTTKCNGDNKEIEVHVNSLGGGSNKQIKVIKIIDGKQEVIEWDGNGEIPENIQEILDGEDIDIMVLDDDNLSLPKKGREVRVFEIEKEKAYYTSSNKNNARLGVHTEETIDGVMIESFTSGSAAEKAGLRRGDIITKIDKKHIATIPGLIKALSPYNPGDKIKVKYMRDGKEKKAKVKLTAQ